MDVDSNDNVYIGGFTHSDLTTLTDASDEKNWFAKYDSSGMRQWIVQFGVLTENEELHAMAIDSNDNIYIGGETDGALDGGSNAGGEDAWFGNITPEVNAGV